MKIAMTLILIAAILVAVAAWLNRPHPITIDAALPVDFPSDGFPHESFEQLLRDYVDEAGKVDYERWVGNPSDVRILEEYLAAVAAFSPETTPERFDGSQDELAYWLYSYNAYVIWAILDRWPLDSVTAVRAPLEFVKGFGFFYQLRFLFGGRQYSLYAVENDIVRGVYRDARIHFVLNCGSESCPVLRPELPAGSELEPFLQQAAVDFVSDERNVFIDHGSREVVLSAIFKWFRKDFINDLRRRGLPSDRGLLDYVGSVAPAALSEDLKKAHDYAIVFTEYDWSVNRQESSTQQ